MKKLTLAVIVIMIITALSGFRPADAADTAKCLSGVWLSTVKNLDYPSKQGLTKAELAAQLDEAVSTCKSCGINAIFFQVRPNADALYKSDIFPWSEVLSGAQGTAPDGNFDPLEYLVKTAHANGIQVHAWINPYRIGKSDGDIQKILQSLSADNPAVKNPEYYVTCYDGGVYFNPAIPQVRRLIISGVEEIVKNYAVDGIHFDDYFYPYGVTDYPDAAQYEQYGGDFDDIADFRCNNVNLLVKETCSAIHKINKNVKFGISPFGIWDNAKDNPDGSQTAGMSSYRSIYADSKTWVENKWVDYICPQIYWAFETKAAPFDKLASWWDALCDKNGVTLYTGHALYKLGSGESGFESASQISRQLDYCRSIGVSGNVFFRYGTLRDNVGGCKDLLRARLCTDTDNDETFMENALEFSPTQAYTSSKLDITSPQNGCVTTDSHISVTGVADPAYELTAGGNSVSVTEHGYFSVYLPLKTGTNKFTFKNGSSEQTVSIVRSSPDTAYETVNGFFKKDSAVPATDSMYYSGERLEFSVSAKEGSEVYADFCGEQIRLTAQGEAENGFVRFTAARDAPYIMCGQYEWGSSQFYVISEGKRINYSDACAVKVSAAPVYMYTLEESYVYNGIGTGSMMDNYQLPKGTRVSVTGIVNGYSRLQSGKWINSSCLGENPPAESTAQDSDKYSRIDLSFERLPEFQCDVTEGGVLLVNLYGAVSVPEILQPSASVSVDFVQKGADITAVFSSQSGTVEGFDVSRTGDNTLSVRIYTNRSGGISGKTIVIDPGHGGTDRGALGPAGDSGVCENDLNLSISYILAQKLRALGANVQLTRTDDTALPLALRRDIIAAYDPDISISIHSNSVSSGSDFNTASGILSLYSRNTSLQLCKAISDGVANGLQVENTGIKMQSLNVCREYRFPCVLVECGFVCNPAEYEKLLTDEYKNTLCDNIVLSLCDYFR